MKRIRLSTITIISSVLFFLVTSAFTFAPKKANSLEMETIEINLQVDAISSSLLEFETTFSDCGSGCCTCTFGGSGEPNGCKDAQYCGMSSCRGNCDMDGGELCGLDCGLY